MTSGITDVDDPGREWIRRVIVGRVVKAGSSNGHCRSLSVKVADIVQAGLTDHRFDTGAAKLLNSIMTSINLTGSFKFK